jgi:hypothetical protein
VSAAAIRADLAMLATWPPRPWLTAAAATVAFVLVVAVLVVAVPTDLIDNPAFSSAVPTTWGHGQPTSALGGLLLASYVNASPGTTEDNPRAGLAWVCWRHAHLPCRRVPVCNKLALLPLGSAGALRKCRGDIAARTADLAMATTITAPLFPGMAEDEHE